jgi:hypothetical protein
MEQIKGTYNMKAQFLHETLNNRVLHSPKKYGFYIFSWKFTKKASQIQIFRILESLVDFKFNFKIYNSGLKAFKKLSLSLL